MNLKAQFFATAMLVGLVGSSSAATTFEHTKTLNFENPAANSTLRVTSAAADEDGNIYFTSNFNDRISTFNPMTIPDPANPDEYQGTYVTDIDAATQTNLFSSSSYIGITVDKDTGDVFAAGPSNSPTATGTPTGVITRVSNTGGTWVSTPLNQAGLALAGIQSLGNNQFVLSDARTGALHFYELDTAGTALVPKGTASGQTGIWAPSLAADVAGGKIYQARATHLSPSTTSQIDSFSFSFPFATGTSDFDATSLGTLIPGLPSGVTAGQPLQYQSISVSSDGKYIAFPVNVASAATTDMTENYFAVYDVSGPTPVLVASLDGSEDPNQADGHRADTRGFGCTFFTYNNEEYLFTFFSGISGSVPVPPYTSRVARGYVYKITQTSTVDGWNLY